MSKKIWMSTFGVLLASTLFLIVGLANAVEPWDVTGSYVIGFDCTPSCAGPYNHDAFLTQTGSSVTGDGGFPAGGGYTFHWNITSGLISGSTINLSMDYDLGAPSTTMTMTGTIALDGSMSGTWTDNFGGTRNGTWETSSGFATRVLPEECDGIVFPNSPIMGTSGSDNINGTPDNDVIFALGGSDRVDGKGGDDCIVGGAGSDRLIGGNGADVILGGDGSDSIQGNNDADKLYGQGASDSISGDNGADELYGGDGSDSLKGGNQSDTILGGDGSDSLRGDGGSDNLDGEGGVDSANGGTGSDTCTAESETACEI